MGTFCRFPFDFSSTPNLSTYLYMPSYRFPCIFTVFRRSRWQSEEFEPNSQRQRPVGALRLLQTSNRRGCKHRYVRTLYELYSSAIKFTRLMFFFFLQLNLDFWTSREKPNGNPGMARKVWASTMPKTSILKPSINLLNKSVSKIESGTAHLKNLAPIFLKKYIS